MRDICVVEDEFVVAFGGEVDCGGCDAEGSESEDGPGSGAERPGDIEVPAVPEAGVVIKEESLRALVKGSRVLN